MVPTENKRSLGTGIRGIDGSCTGVAGDEVIMHTIRNASGPLTLWGCQYTASLLANWALSQSIRSTEAFGAYIHSPSPVNRLWCQVSAQ